MRDHFQKLFGPLNATVLRLKGRSRVGGNPLTAVYLGNRTNLAFVTRYFFASAETHCVREGLRQSALRGAAREVEEDVDLVITEQPPVWAWLRPPPSDFTVPAWIRQELPLEKADDRTGRLFPTALEKEVRRLQGQHNYSLSVSWATDHLHGFYHDFYLPYIRARFGESAVIVPEADFVNASRGSRIARLYSGTQWVAGMLIKRHGAKLRLGWFGCLEGRVFQGASEVLDALCIRHEFEKGVRIVVMGNSRPCLSDGVVRYKGRFGARIRATRFPQSIIGFSVRRWTDSLCECLRQHPLVSIGNGVASVVRVSDRTENPRLSFEPIEPPHFPVSAKRAP